MLERNGTAPAVALVAEKQSANPEEQAASFQDCVDAKDSWRKLYTGSLNVDKCRLELHG